MMSTHNREKWMLICLLLAFVGLGFTATVINPLHEATDELRHYRFVQHIVQKGALPVQGKVGCSAQGHHPPLFYLMGAAATFWIDTGRDVCYAPPSNPFWAYRYADVGVDNKNQYLHGADEAFPWQGEALAAHLIRLVNVLIGAGVVWLTWQIGHTIWPERPFLALGSAAFVAFNPMFVYMAGAINNDVMAAFSGAAVTLACVRLLRDEHGLSPRWGLILGTLFGIALMSKFNLAAIALLIETAVTWVAWRQKQWRQWLIVNSLITGATLLIAGWWFIRNQLLYGEPTGVQRLTELWGVRDPRDSFDLAVFELPYAWTSLWGRFGYGQIPLPDAIYNSLRWLATFALAGLTIPLLRQRRQPQVIVPLLFLSLNVFLFAAVLFSYLLISPAGPMGRFFFPALPSLAVLLFVGLSGWLSLITQAPRANNGLAIAINVTMMTLTLVALFGYLAPAYAQPRPFDFDNETPTYQVNAQFDSFVKLHGYNISTTTLQPNGAVDIDLYWEVIGKPPGNYLMFVHLIDESGTMVAQRDTHPGLGNFPSSQWQFGDHFMDTIRLYLPDTAYSPTTATLSLGFYAPVEGYRLGIRQADGRGIGDALTLATVAIEPADLYEVTYPNPTHQNFEDEVRLVGYQYDQRQLQPDTELAVTLYWESLAVANHEHIVQVQLLDEGAHIISQTEALLPLQRSGERLNETYLLPIPAHTVPNSYQIGVTLLDADTNQRQNIVADDGHWLYDRVTLARVRVQ